MFTLILESKRRSCFKSWFRPIGMFLVLITLILRPVIWGNVAIAANKKLISPKLLEHKTIVIDPGFDLVSITDFINPDSDLIKELRKCGQRFHKVYKKKLFLTALTDLIRKSLTMQGAKIIIPKGNHIDNCLINKTTLNLRNNSQKPILKKDNHKFKTNLNKKTDINNTPNPDNYISDPNAKEYLINLFGVVPDLFLGLGALDNDENTGEVDKIKVDKSDKNDIKKDSNQVSILTLVPGLIQEPSDFIANPVVKQLLLKFVVSLLKYGVVKFAPELTGDYLVANPPISMLNNLIQPSANPDVITALAPYQLVNMVNVFLNFNNIGDFNIDTLVNKALGIAVGITQVLSNISLDDQKLFKKPTNSAKLIERSSKKPKSPFAFPTPNDIAKLTKLIRKTLIDFIQHDLENLDKSQKRLFVADLPALAITLDKELNTKALPALNTAQMNLPNFLSDLITAFLPILYQIAYQND